MIQAMHAKAWGTTPLGAMSTWPASLRTAVSICLNSQFAMVVFWGPELIFIYNDAYIPMLGDKHPQALGQPGSVVWSEVWPTIGHLFDNVLTSGSATRGDDLFLPLERHGFVEECYFTYSHSPIRNESGGIGGVFTAVLETTTRVINERRMRTLGDLAGSVSLVQDQANMFRSIAEVLSRNPYDLPFAALYLLDSTGEAANLALCCGFDDTSPSPNAQIGGNGPLMQVTRTSEAGLYDAQTVFGEISESGVWPRQAKQALALPFCVPGHARARGVFAVGINPRRPFDQAYRDFFDLVLGHIGTAISNIEAVETERRRVESLAQLDRAKSQFFSDASHELRTPITLILGPLKSILDHDVYSLPSLMREHLETAARNALKLRKLVDSILDFASIEAGRLSARLEPTDVAALTTNIASSFRSAIESAALRFSVRCPAPVTDVLIDREMWGKMVSNLISNAFKFTEHGEIEVVLECDHASLQLAVRDTGIGIPAEEMPHIFERFYRGQARTGRATEGSGIGLSLVQELVQLHGGTVTAESVVGQGASFIIKLPLRTTQAPAAMASGNAQRNPVRRNHSVPWMDHSALRYDDRSGGRDAVLANAVAPAAREHPLHAEDRRADSAYGKIKVLIVEDNEDLVRWIEILLQDKCEVISVRNGWSGLEMACKSRPDVIITDIMMPGLDGISLLRAIRAEKAVHTVPVIVLSAKAEEHVRLEALDAGADDYLLKPFDARELAARVYSHVRMVRVRRAAVEREGMLLRKIAEVEQDLERVLQGTSDTFAHLDRDLHILALNDAAARLIEFDRNRLIGRSLMEVAPNIAGSELERILRDAIEKQVIASVEHFHVRSARWFSFRCYPTLHGAAVFGAEITERKKAEQALLRTHAELETKVAGRTRELQEASELLAAVFDRAPGGIAITDIQGKVIRANAAYQRLLCLTEPELLAHSPESLAHPQDYSRKKALLQQLLDGARESFEMEMRYCLPAGAVIWVSIYASKIDDQQHRPRCFIEIAQNITDRKRAEQDMLSSQRELRALYDRLQTVREEERVALAREVHDQLGQILSAAKIDIKLLEDDIRPQNAPLSRRKILLELRSARRTLEEGIQSVRRIATELRPPELEDQGLRAAIEWHTRDFERRTRIKCSVAFTDEMREPNPTTALALFRIFQEAMTNVLRHSNASRVWIALGCRGHTVLLRVRDNGVGITSERIRRSRSIGVKGMRERAAIIRGRLLLGRMPSGGTLVSVRAPLEEDGFPYLHETSPIPGSHAGDAG